MDEAERICRLIESENSHFRVVKPLVRKIRKQEKEIEKLKGENDTLRNQLKRAEDRQGIGLCLPIDLLEGSGTGE